MGGSGHALILRKRATMLDLDSDRQKQGEDHGDQTADSHSKPAHSPFGLPNLDGFGGPDSVGAGPDGKPCGHRIFDPEQPDKQGRGDTA